MCFSLAKCFFGLQNDLLLFSLATQASFNIKNEKFCYVEHPGRRLDLDAEMGTYRRLLEWDEKFPNLDFVIDVEGDEIELADEAHDSK